MLVIEDLPLALVPYKFRLNIPTAYKIDLSIAASLSVLLWKSLSEREVLLATSYSEWVLILLEK